MPKGDRELFKADTQDGYTKIANLLLEALAMAKLNGVQKGICLFLWRRTYGWGLKEDQITLKEFAQACDTSEPYASRQLKQLVNWNIIMRSSYDPGKIPTYTFNTRVAQWDKGCTNVQGLNDCEIQGLYKCTIQGLYDCTRVNQAPAQENQGVTPSLKKIERHTKEIYIPPTPQKGGARRTDPRIKQVIDFYHDQFVQKFGEKPVIDGPKDGAVIKKLLGTHDLDKLLWLIRRFFASKDPWIQNSGYTIGVLKTQINKLLVQAKGGGNSGRAGPSEKDTDDLFIN